MNIQTYTLSAAILLITAAAPAHADIFSPPHPDVIRTNVQPAAVAPNSWRGILCGFRPRLLTEFSSS